MSEHDASRREFLRRAAVGVGTAAGAGMMPEAIAEGRKQDKQSKPETNAASHQQSHDGLGAFFNRDDAATIAALAEVIMPGAPGKPGSRDAGVLNYIDLALAGAYADLQNFYRNGLKQLEQYCRETYHESFVHLSTAQQQSVVGALEEGKAAGFTWPTAQSFFETVRTHTMEGMFADPVYGGNKDFAGWRLVGFPGAQPIFTATDMQSKQAFTRAPITGLQGQAKRA